MTHIDSLVDELLREEKIFNLILPRLPKRDVLEKYEGLPPYVSPLDIDSGSETTDM